MKHWFITLILLFSLLHVFGEVLKGEACTDTVITSSANNLKHRVELTSQYTFNGILTGVGYAYCQPAYELAVALRAPLINVAKLTYGGTGGQISFRKLFPLNIKNARMVVDVSYGNLLYGTHSPVDDRKGLYQLHEVYLNYGWMWHTKRLTIANTFGYGTYTETQTNFYSSGDLKLHGHGAQVKLWIGYDF